MTTVQTSFSTVYADKAYQHPATVRHNGTVIAFAMDQQRKIYYTVLDINTPDAKPIDAENWLKEPKELLFANEITQVGYGGFDLTTLPVVKKNGDVVIPGTRVQPQELDSFQSSTARLTANAPFQVMSDDQYLYVFRQAIAADHPQMVFKQNADGTEITDATGKKVPLVNSTLLLDRFVLSGTELQPKLEVRYQRSRSKSRPQSSKDSLSAKDMEGKPFYEPTQELDFISHLSEGCFTVLLLPTQIPEQKRWQIFAYNSQTILMDAYNIEQSGDGLFNTRDLEALAEGGVITREVGAESAIALNGQTDYLEFPSLITNDTGTIEFRLKLTSLDDQILLDATTTATTGANPLDEVKYFFIDIKKGALRFWLEDARDADFQAAVASLQGVALNQWHHVAAVWNYNNTSSVPVTQLYLNGKLVAKDERIAVGRPTLQNPYFGKIRNTTALGQPEKSLQLFKGQVDEIRFWKVALTSPIIQAQMPLSLRGNEPGLVGYWRCDEGKGETLHDSTSFANHAKLVVNGNDAIATKWVQLVAGILEPIETLRSSFALRDRTITAGMSALLYFQQETAPVGYDNAEKPLKKSARVMLAVGTKATGSDRQETAIVDFGVARTGRISQPPDALDLPAIDPVAEDRRRIQILEPQIAQLQQQVRSLQERVGKLPSGNSEDPLFQSLVVAKSQLEKASQELEQRKARVQGNNTISFDQAMLRLSPVEATVQRLQVELQPLQQEVKRLQEIVQGWQTSIQTIEQEMAQRQAELNALSTNIPPTSGGASPEVLNLLKKQRELEDVRRKWRDLQEYLKYPLYQLTAKQTELAAKQQELELNQQELAQLKAILQGSRQFPMPPIYIDPVGLTVSGTVFNLTASKDTPRLFDSANGNLILYLRGANNEFYSAQYDTLTERVLHEVAATEGSLVFIARTAGSQMDTATIVIQSSSTDTEEICTVALSNPVMGITETWNKVPRQVAQFAQVINGEANNSQDDFYYDYSANVKVEGITSSNQFQGSLLFVVANNAKGVVKDGAIQGSEVKTRSAQWTSFPLGNALQFDGKDDFVSLKSDSQLPSFDAAGDLTLEVWVKPTPKAQEGASRLIGHRSDRSQYSLALQTFASTYGAIEMNGETVFELNGISSQDAFSFGDTSFTIEFWAKRSAVDRTEQIFQSETTASDYQGLTLSFDRAKFVWVSTVGFSASNVLSTPEYPDTNWHHWACTYDRSTNVRKIYCDGELVAQDALPNRTGVYISRTILGSFGDDQSFKGSLDEIRIWNYVRPAKQINSDMRRHLRSSQPGLQACWGMSVSSIPKDYSGYNRPISLLQGTAQVGTGAFVDYGMSVNVGNQQSLQTKEAIVSSDTWNHLAAVYNQSYALQFNGVDSYLECGNATTLDINRDLTIEAFLKVDSLGVRRGIVTKGILDDGTDQDVPYAFYVDRDGKLVFAFEDTAHTLREFSSNQALEAGKFYRVAVTRKPGFETKEQKDGDTTTGVIVKQWDDIQFYINRQEVGSRRYDFDSTDKTAVGNSSQPFEIGKAYLSGARPTFFHGSISEVRVWGTALGIDTLGVEIKGSEKGLISWWRMEENAGAIAYDSKSNNHATGSNIQWVKNPDPQGSSFTLYCNGQPVPTQKINLPADQSQFMLGACKRNGNIEDAFCGTLEEVRIWKVARTPEQIRDNLFRRLSGEQEHLIANYTFDAEAADELRDYSFQSNHLALATGNSRPTYVFSTAPISNDVPQVRDAVAGIRTAFHDVLHSPVSVQEYGDMQSDVDGNLIGVLKRCHTFIQDHEWHILTGYKVGNLITEWIGQVQFAPQLIGYIEGAPPVPSENLTVKDKDYTGATSVEMTEAASVVHTYSASRDTGFDMAIAASIGIGFKSETSAGLIVATTVEETTVQIGAKAAFENSLGWLDDASVGTGKVTSKTSKLDLQGRWDAKNQRFAPRNLGFALVQSETADVFALRMQHNNVLVSYQMRPNPDIPKDWNILTFPINAAYTKQGTLDGKVGLAPDTSYPNAMSYSSDISYFKPIEAYQLKNRIQRQEEELRSYYDQYNAGGMGRRQAATHFSQGDLATGRLLDKLPKPEKRNLSNTYVWTADGGLFTESETAIDMRQETTGGAYAFTGMAGIYASGEIAFKAAIFFELEALFGGHLNLTVAKTQDSETSFGLNVNLDGLERDIYDPTKGDDLNDPFGDRSKLSGKVDAYRFMTFYLQPDVQHFNVFIDQVVDSIWLNQSQHPNAIALRQAVQAQKQAKDKDKSLPWRVMHRVTYCSRVLPKVGTAPASLEKALSDLDIDSNWQLIKRLEPFVKGKASVDFNAAVSEAIAQYLPELKPHTSEIIRYMRLYFQVPEEA